MLMVLIFIDYLWGCQEDLVLCLNFSSLEKMNVLFPSPPYPVLLCIDSRVNCFILPNTFWLYFLSPSLHVWERKKTDRTECLPITDHVHTYHLNIWRDSSSWYRHAPYWDKGMGVCCTATFDQGQSVQEQGYILPKSCALKDDIEK